MNWLGVMGVINPLQVEKLLELTPLKNKDLVVGILVNENVFDGVPDPSQRYRYPKDVKEIPEIFNFGGEKNESIQKFVKLYWEDDHLLNLWLRWLAELELEGAIDGIMLSGYPRPEELAELKFSFPLVDIILDVGELSVDGIEVLDEYKDNIEGVIVKASTDIKVVRELMKKYPFFDLGFYGMYTPEEFNRVRQFPYAGALLEEEVRTNEDHLDLVAAAEYLKKLAL